VLTGAFHNILSARRHAPTLTRAFSVILLFVGTFLLEGTDQIAIIGIGQPWAYLYETNVAFPADGAWRDRNYDDSEWLRGSCGFSSLRDEATWLTNASAFASALFRKSFHVDDTNAIQSLVLRTDYNAGFIAFLNGQEVARRGLPEGQIDYETYAPSSRVRGSAEIINLTSRKHLLIAGTNLFAVELHSASNTPFNKALVAELLANFQRGPFVQSVTTTSAQIVWQTSLSSTGIVVAGTTSNALNLAFATAAPTSTHAVSLTGLSPGTRYFYQVRSWLGNEGPAVSPIFSFRTFAGAGEITFALVGDSGGGSTAQYNVARQIELAAPNLVLHLGDIVYDSFKSNSADLRFLSVYRNQMREVPWFTTMGNHDIDVLERDTAYLAAMVLPTNSASGTEHYYSFDHGEAHFVCLFIPDLKFRPDLASFALTNGSTQYHWLTNDLAGTSKPWKILFFHSPISTSSFHAGEDDNANNISDQIDLQQIILPIASNFGVQIIFNGHDHNFERFAPIQGVHRVVSGGGGRSVSDMFRRDETSSQFYSRSHFVRARLNAERLQIEAVDDHGEIFDSMVIHRAQPITNFANWHSPMVELSAADDGDGNIHGQAFDFMGDGIPSRAGEWSNLGTLYVNNDETNLYLGLRDVMIQNTGDLYFLIDAPTLTGVSNLIGLGDGISGTLQGLDALDFAENLLFTNFSPSIVAIVGDETADGTFPRFTRSNTVFETGQGVFFLSNSFPAMSGARIQQYNRSPQTTNAPGHQGFRSEQNADFIEISIPFSALGGLRPHHTIKVAVVTGGALIESNSQVRVFDTSGVGRLSGSGTNSISVEPVLVQLSEGVDTDGDGLLDEWELAHNLDPHSATGNFGADGDPDHDGFKNSSEQFAGTDPHDPLSALRVRVAFPGQNIVRISWDAVIGKQYQLEYSDASLSSFLTVPGNEWPRTADQTELVFDDTLPANTSTTGRFYRVRVVR
jgi:hypothetical protein